MEAQKITDLVNQARQQVGIKSLSTHELLQSAAEQKIAEMKSQNYFSHQNGGGETISSLIPSTYHYYAIGENLAFGYETEEAIVGAWMKSPTHKDNLLDPQYKDTAISFTSVNGKTLVAQVFGVEQQEYFASKEASASLLSVQGMVQISFVVSSVLLLLVLGSLLAQKLKIRG